MTIQKKAGLVSLLGLLSLSIAALIACGSKAGESPTQVAATAPTPTSTPILTLTPEPISTNSPAIASQDITVELLSTSVINPTVFPEPSHTPIPAPTPTHIPIPTPTPTLTPTPIPTSTPIPETIVNDFGFKLRLHGNIPVQVGEGSEGNVTNEQGTISFPYHGVIANITWDSSISEPQQVLANTYKRLREGQSSLIFEPVKDGVIPVSGERGVFGAFRVLDATETVLGGGFISAWICSKSLIRYSLTVTGSHLTSVQIRFQSILTAFRCPS